MAYQVILGFETGDMSEARGSGGTLSVQSSVKRSGSYALRVNPSAGTGYYDVGKYDVEGNLGATFPSAPYFTGYMRFAALPGANTTVLRLGSNTGTGTGNTTVEVKVDASGVLTIAGATTSATVATLSTGTWYRLQVKAVINSTCEASIDGGTAQTCTGYNYDPAYCQLGTATGTVSYDMYWDDLAIATTAYTGAGKAVIMKPNATGNYTAWTDGAGTAPTNVAEVPHDSDTGYITSSTLSDAETEALDSAATAGVAGTIGAILVLAIERNDAVAYTEVKLRLRSGSTDSDITNSTFSTSYRALGRIVETDPATSSAWTAAGLDGIEVGLVANTSGKTYRCTALMAMVWCTGQINTTVTPGAASLTLTAYSPSAKVNNIATPGALSLTATRYTPSAILNNIVTPGALSAALTAYAPAALVGLAVTPGTLATALTAYTPTVVNPQSATPGTLALALTAYEPGAIVNHIATPGAGSMALTAYAPTVLTPVVVTPGAGSLALTAYAPSVVLNFAVTPGAGSLAIATYGINIYLPGSAFGARQYWRSTQHREYTKLVPYRDYRRSTTYKDYIKHVKWVDRA